MSKILLPPIHTLAPQMPILELDVIDPSDQPQLSDDEDKSRSVYFSSEEDIMILRTIMNYFGPTFTGRIPWGFWEIYKRTTGSWRSYSSLYHHWVGSLMRKYRVFLEKGMIADCVRYLEASRVIEQATTKKASFKFTSTFKVIAASSSSAIPINAF